MSQKWTLHKDDLTVIDKLLDILKGELKKFQLTTKYKFIVSEAETTRQSTMNSVGNCYFPDCNNQSISNSHSISNKLMLEPISEHSHVITPELDPYFGGYKANKIGLKKATVFPGFCGEHENSFHFEKDGIIKDEVELQKHLFRTVCYQLHFLKSELAKLKKAQELFYLHFDALIYEIVPIDELISSNDQIIGYLRASLFPYYEIRPKQLEEDIKFTKEHWYIPNADSFGKGLSHSYHSELIQFTLLNTVVLSCPVLSKEELRNEEGTPIFEHIYYVNIFPNKGHTMIYLVSLKKQKETIIELAEEFEENGDSSNEYMYRLMLNNTENWFLTPSIWEGLSKERQNLILKAMSRVL